MLRCFDGSSPHALQRYQHFRVMPHEVVADPRWKRPPKAASRCGTNARHSPPGREPLLDCPEASSKVWTVRKAARRLGEPWKQVGWLLMKARRAGGGGLSGRRSFAQEPLGPCCRALQPLSRRAGGRGAPQPRSPRVEPSEPPQRGWICKPTFEGPAIVLHIEEPGFGFFSGDGVWK